MASQSAYKQVSYSDSYSSQNAQLHKDLNITYPSFQSYYQNFDRYYSIYNNLEMDALRQWVFFVRPECNIVQENNSKSPVGKIGNDRFMMDMINRHNIVTLQLTNQLSYDHDFMTFLVGRTESLQLPDLSIKNYTISQPYTNLLMPYGGNAWESKTGGTFDVTFREDASLRIHRLFQTWVHYIDGVTRGEWSPKSKYWHWNKFDYTGSVYYFICGPDGETILWWGKYTGVFPTAVPNSDMSFNLRGGAENKTSIPFVYYYFEALNPDVIVDFNRNAHATGTLSYVPHYDPDIVGSPNGVVGIPFIGSENNGYTYKLYWREPKTF